MRIINKNNLKYYIESEEELADIPINAPAGTIAECNASDGFTAYMKNEAGEWNQLKGVFDELIPYSLLRAEIN